MSDAEVKAEARLWTLKSFVCEIFALWCVQQETPGVIFSRLEQRMKDAARKRTFEVHPVMSDYLSAELENAVGRLMGMQTRQLKAHLKPSQMSEFAAALKRE